MLQTQDLKVALDAEQGLVKAIDGLTLAIQRGETFALVGESGCGKSMTALALMRLLPENGRITGGTVRLDREEHEEFGTQRLDLVSRGDRVEVAGFLGPAAKAELADCLNRALVQARRGFHYS